jgi:hypothetical protein
MITFREMAWLMMLLFIYLRQAPRLGASRHSRRAKMLPFRISTSCRTYGGFGSHRYRTPMFHALHAARPYTARISALIHRIAATL